MKWPKNAASPAGRRRSSVREVRRHLWHYGIRPTKFTVWQATWTWAYAIAKSYWHIHWPSPSEIATQYILLLLTEMKSSCMLKLPYRAQEIVPAEVAAMLPVQPMAIAEDRPLRRRKRIADTR